MERGEKRKEGDKEVSAKGAQQDVFTVKLLKKKGFAQQLGERHTYSFYLAHSMSVRGVVIDSCSRAL